MWDRQDFGVVLALQRMPEGVPSGHVIDEMARRRCACFPVAKRGRSTRHHPLSSRSLSQQPALLPGQSVASTLLIQLKRPPTPVACPWDAATTLCGPNLLSALIPLNWSCRRDAESCVAPLTCPVCRGSMKVAAPLRKWKRTSLQLPCRPSPPNQTRPPPVPPVRLRRILQNPLPQH